MTEAKELEKLRRKVNKLQNQRNTCIENYEYSKAEYYHRLFEVVNSKLKIAKRNHIELYCNFCGKFESEVKTLLKHNEYFICNECIEAAYKVIHK